MNRRGFIKTAGLAGTGVVSGSLLAAPVEAATTTAVDPCSSSLPDNRGYAYFGEPGKRKPQKNVFKYHYTPATNIDFGLTPEQEARAKSLHESLYVFDAEFGSTYFIGMHELMLSGKSAGVGGNSTIGKGVELCNAADENIERTRADWGSRESLDRV